MTNELYRPFFDATRDVFRLMLDLSNVTEKPGREASVPGGSLSIAIGVTGDLTGQVVYRFPKETSLRMVRILSGMEFSEIDDFVTSAIGEIANIISGNVMSALTAQSLACDIQPPRVAAEGDGCLTDSACCHTTCISTDVGPIELLISLAPGKKQ